MNHKSSIFLVGSMALLFTVAIAQTALSADAFSVMTPENNEAEYDFDSSGYIAILDKADSPIIKIAEPKPIHSLTIMNPSGKTATIDFNGDIVTFGGDLPVSEAAKIFFESVHGLCERSSK